MIFLQRYFQFEHFYTYMPYLTNHSALHTQSVTRATPKAGEISKEIENRKTEEVKKLTDYWNNCCCIILSFS